MSLWLLIKRLFTGKEKPRPTTQVFRRAPRPTFERKKVIPDSPTPKLDEAIGDDKGVCHVDFGKVRKITRKFERKNKRLTEFYDEDGDLIQD